MDDQRLRQSDELDLPEPLRRELRAIVQPGIVVPKEVDRAITEAARARFARRPALRRMLPWSAAAAIAALAATLVLAVLLPHFSRQSEAGIMRAFTLARMLSAGEHPGAQWDADHDGVVDRRDIETLAREAVALDQGPGAQDQSQAESPSPSTSGRFAAVEVYLDPRGKPLAAYQLRFAAKLGSIRIVGIENGDAEPFRDQPPYYDLKAVDSGKSDHLTIAMFSTREALALPSAKTRVTTVHVWIEGDVQPIYDAKLEVAAGPDGKTVAAEVSLHDMSQEGTAR